MKRIYLILIVFLLAGFGLSAQQTLLLEDFEGGFPSEWTPDGSGGDTDWQVGSNLSSTGFTVPPHTNYAGSNDFACQCDLNSDILISDTINLSSMTGLYVSFDSYLPTNYGIVSKGYLLVKEPNGAWVEVAEVTSDASWQTWTYNLDASLVSFVGSDVVLGFKHSDQGGQGMGWMVDDVHVYAQHLYDIGVFAWGSPITGCLSSTETVSVEVKNFGLNPVTGFDIFYTLNSSPSATDNVTGVNILPGATYIHTFAGTVNLIAEAAHEFNVNVTTTGDLGSNNTSFDQNIIVKRYDEIPVPFTEDYDQNESYYWEVNSNADAQSIEANQYVEMYGTSNPGWQGGLTSTSASNAWNDNTNYHSVISLRCNSAMVPQNSANLELVLDLRQETQLSFTYSWFAVFVNGTQIADIDGNMNFNPTSQNSDPWTLKTFNLTAYNNTEFTVELKACTHHPADKVFIDNVTIQPRNEADAGVISLLSPVSECGLSDVSDITVIIKNYGVESISNVPVYYTIDGGSEFLAGYAPASILPGQESLPYTFNSKPTAGLEVTGNHQINVYTKLAGDIYFPGNDALLVDLVNIPVYSSFPYEQDFESTHFWSADGTNSSWAVGVASGTLMTANPLGQNSWVTNPSGNYNNDEFSYVYSPCFNFASLSDPYFEMSLWYETDGSYDGSQLQISLDNGTSWDVVGEAPAIPNGDNWYVLTVEALGTSEEGWTGSNGGWVTAHYSLLAYAGETSVKFRIAFASDADNLLNGSPVNYDGVAFDDIVIRDPQAAWDIKAVEWLSPVTNYNLASNEVVSVVVENLGLNTITTFTGVFSIDNGSSFTSPFTFNVNIPSGGTETVYFTNDPADFSAWGTYDCIASFQLVDDGNSVNDLVTATVMSLPTINTFPYTEYFQGPQEHWWTTAGSNNSWDLGVPVGTSISSDTLGDIAWITRLNSGNHYDNEFSWVESPNFDLSSLIQPIISMRIAYATESGSDGANLQYSEAGGPWTTIGVVGVFPNLENWYINNVDGLVGEAGWTGNSGSWITATQDLSMLQGMTSVKLRILFGSDGTNNNEGMAFDDIVVEEGAPHDLAVTEWQSQSIACGLSASEIITVKIENPGFFTEDNFNVSYSIDFNGTVIDVTENVTTPVLPGDFLLYSFTLPFDFSVPGNYSGIVTVALIDDVDGDLSNNEIIRNMLSSPLVNVFPYFEGFEGTNGNWFVGGTDASWAVGNPAGTTIGAAGSGADSWVTNLNGEYNPLENSYVESPCFDFSGMSNPTIQFKYTSDSEPYYSNAFDGAILEFSTDGGYNWLLLGNYGDTVNWYNYAEIWSFANGNGWSGNTSGWLTTGLFMPGLAGELNVKFRFRFASDDYNLGTFEGFGFDDILIYNDVEYAGDLGVSNIVSVIAGCEFSTGYDVSVVIKNFDLTETFTAGNSISLQYLVDGGTPVIESFILQNDLIAQAEMSYTFSTQLTLPAGGIYNISAATLIMNDIDPLNNESTSQLESYFAPVVDVLSISDAACFGSVDGEIVLATNVNYSYLWTDGYTTDIITVGAGDYYVTITDNNACETIGGPFTVGEPVEMTLTLVGADNLCYNDATGSVTLTVNNGVGPYSYLWSNSETTQNLINLVGGTYTVVVTDDNSCEATGSVSLNQAGPFDAVVNINTEIICNGNSTGELEVLATGGSLPYEYLWESGATTSVISALIAGTYYVTVLDANGCSAGGSTPVTDLPVFETIPYPGADHTIIVLPTTSITADGVAINPSEFLIGVFYDSLGVEICAGFMTWEGFVWAIPAVGDNGVPYTGFAPNEEFSWKMLRIADNQLFDAVAVYDNAFPNQGNYVSNGQSSILSLTGTIVTPSPTITPLSATLFEPTVLTVDLYPTNYNGYSISCNGGSDGQIVASGNGGVPGYTYVWDNGQSIENIENLGIGSFVVTVTDLNGCTATDSYTLTEPTALSGSLTVTDVTCNGSSNGTLDLEVVGGLTPYSFYWSNGVTIEDQSGIIAGTYSVTVTDLNGCTIQFSGVINESMALPLVEDFDLGVLPTGWTTSQNVGSVGWQFGTNLSGPFWTIPPHTGYSASSDDAATDPNDASMDYLITPVLDLSGYTSITLTFDAFFEDFYGSNASVEVSTNGGTTWVVVGTIVNNSVWQEDLTVDLTSYTNDPNSCNVLVAFHYDDNGTYATGLAIDNVNISGITQYDYDLAVTDFIIPPAEACNLSATQPVTIEITNVGSLDATNFDLTYTVDGNLSVAENYSGTILAGATATYTFTTTYDFSLEGTYNCGAAVLYTLDMDNSNDVLSGITVNHHPTISSFPYLEDFEDMAMEYFDITVGSEADQSVLTDDGDYSLVVSGGNALVGWSGGSSASANDAWVLNTDHQVNAVTLCSVDASGLQSLELLLDLRQEFATDVTGSWFRVLVDGVQVGSDYNPVLPGEPYQTIQLDLDAYINTTFNLTLQFSNRTAQDLVFVDNLILREKQIDLAVIGVNPPAIACPYTSAEMIEVSIENLGGLSVSNFNLDLVVNGIVTTDVIAGPINPGDIITYTFNNVDLTTLGNYIINVDVNAVDDVDTGNDMYSISLDSYADLAVTGIAPFNICEGVDYSISLTISNLSNGDILAGTVVNASYILNSNTVNEAFTLSADLLAGTSIDLMFAYSENGSNGIYTIDGSALITGDCNNTNDSFIGSIEIFQSPVADAGMPVAVCDGQSVTLTATGGDTYMWSDNVTQGVSFIPLATATYTVTVTNTTTGCTNTDFVEVTVNSLPTADAGQDITVCDGESVTLSATGGMSYAWCCGVTQDVSFVPTTTATYTVTVSDGNNCEDTDEVLVTVNTLPTAFAGNDESICNGESVVLTATGGDSYYWIATGATTAEITVTPSITTIYSVVVTYTTTGCEASDDVTVNVTDGPVVDSYQIVNNLCDGGSDGSISLAISGGLLPYSFLWSYNGATTQDLVNLTAGFYTVTVEDAAGSVCANISTYELIDPTPLIVTVIDTSNNVGYGISCYGANDGTIFAITTNGTPPYTYLWNGGETTDYLENLGPGIYSVTTTDSNGCTANTDFTVTEPVELTAVSVVNSITCSGDNDGSITVTPNGGTEPYVYYWSNGATTQSIENLVAGPYSVYITDSNGCFWLEAAYINEPNPLVVDITDNFDYNGYSISCNGEFDGGVTVNITGGTMPYDILWDNGQNVNTLENLPAGTYSVTITDGNGCIGLGSITLTQPYNAAIATSVTNVSCFGFSDGVINLTISAGGVPPFTYLWSDGSVNEDLTGAVAGTYDVVVTDANGCVFTTSRTITEPTEFILTGFSMSDYNGFGIDCYGNYTGSIEVIVDGGTPAYSYIWDDENSSITSSISSLNAGTYSVTITDGNGCIIIESYTLTQPDVFEITNVSLTNVLCNDNLTGAIDITVVGGVMDYVYSWSNQATTQDLAGVAAGTYDLYLLDANGCEIIDQYTLTEPPVFTDNAIVVDVDCNGNGNGSISLSPDGGVAPYSFLWSNGSTDEDLSNLSGGTYDVAITDYNACVYNYSYSVYEPDVLVINDMLTNILCYGGNNGSISLSVDGGTAPYTYSWLGGEMSSDLIDLYAGTYEVTVTDANGCMAYGSYTLTQPDIIGATAVLVDPLCYGDVNGSIDVTVTGGVLPYYYNWSNNSLSLDQTGIGAGVYTLTVTDGNWCSMVFSYELVEPAELALSTALSNFNGYEIACNGGSNGEIDNTIVGGTTPYTILWNTGATTEDISGLMAGDYSVAISDANGCAISNSTIVLPWTYTVTGSNHSILLNAVEINSLSIASGDYIGVFYDDGGVLKCGGYIDWQNTNTAVTVYGDDSYSTDKDGFADLENFVWKIWRSGDGSIVDVSATYNVFFPNTNQFMSNGLSNVSLLSGTGPAVQPAGSGSWTLTEPDAIVISDVVTLVTCFGGADGMIDLTIAGGVSPFTYSWSNGETSQNIFGLGTGTYDVIVTDANLCEATASIFVDEPLSMVISEVITDVTCYLGNDGAINVTITEGTPPYTYLWLNGNQSDSNTGLTVGTYSLTVTDANYCTVEGSFIVEEPVAVIAAAAVTSDYDGYSVSCFGSLDGIAEATVTSGGVAPFTYLWSDGQTDAIATGLGVGSYMVTVYDSNLCEGIASVTLTEPLALQADAVVSSDYNGYDVSCVGSANGTVDLTVNIGFPPYTFVWSGTSQTTEDLVGLAAGTYEVTITDSHQCVGYASVTLVDPPELNYTAVVTNAACNGGATGSIDINITGGTGTGTYLYFWSTGENTEDISNLPVGFYYVLVLDANWCHLVTEVFEVTEPNMLLTTISITSDYDGYSVSCLGAADGSIELTVGGGTEPYSYIWSNGSVIANPSGLVAGTYSVTVEDYNGCMGYATVELTEPMLFEAMAYSTFDYNGYSVSCNGLLDGGVSINLVNGFGPFSYLWDNGSTDAMIENVGAGTYLVTVTDSHGCDALSQITLTESGLFEVTGTITSDYSGYNISCNGGNDGAITTLVTGGVMPYTYSWSNGEVTADITNSTFGTQEIVVTDANGCVASTTFELTEPDVLFADAFVNSDYNGSQISCNGMQDGSIDLVVTGGTGVGTYSYMWDNGEITEDLNGIGAGVYEVLVTDANGCSSIAFVEIVEPEMMDIDVTWFNSLCYGSNNGLATVNVTGGTSPYMYFWSNAATAQTIGNLSPGLYYVFGLDANLCATNTYPIEITEPEELILDAVVINNNICYDDTDGEIDLSVVGGTAPYNITWSNGENTEDISSLPAGIYSVTVVDSHGCTKVTNAEITEPAQISISIDVVHVACYNLGTGEVDMTIANGVAPFTYDWSNGGTSEDLTGLSGGFYFVTITDATGCTAASGTVVNEPAEIVLTITSQDQSCFGVSDGSASVSVIGGTYPPYVYLWSNGETTTDISGLSAGVYEVTVTDANGCTERSETEIYEPAQIILDFTGVDAYCNDGNLGSIDLTATGGTLPYTYNWSNGDNTEDVNGLSSGTHNVTVTDANGCLETGSYTIFDAIPVDITFTSTPTSCFGDDNGSIDLTVGGGVAPYSIMWSGGNLGQTGSFNWTYTNTGSNHTILIPNTISLNIGGMPIDIGDYLGVFFDNNGVLECAGYTAWTGNSLAMSAWGSETGMTNGFASNELFKWKVWRASDGIVIDAEAGYEITGFPNTDAYFTNGISALTSIVASMEEDLSGLTAGTYSVTVTDAVGCTGIEDIVVSQPSDLLTSVIGTDISCNGLVDGSVNLTVIGGTPPYNYTWSNSETTQDISGLSAGIHSVIITDANGCVKNASVSIVEPGVLDFSWTTTDVVCYGDATGTASISIVGGTAPFTADWGSADPMALSVGIYSVVVTDVNGCNVSHDIEILEPTELVASYVESMVSCFGFQDGSIDLSVTGGVTPYTYSWTNGSSDEDLSGLGYGDYEYVVTDANGCTFTAVVSITQPDELILSGVVTDLVCFGNPTGAVDITVTGGTEPYGYSWTNGDLIEDLTNIYAGNYEVIVTDANGCSVSMLYEVVEPTEIIVSYVQTDVTCYGGSDGAVDITVEGGIAPYTYSWLSGESVADLAGLTVGDYTLLVTDANNCEITTVVSIIEPLAIELVFDVTNVSCYGLADGTIDMTILNGVAPFSIMWSNSSTSENLSTLAPDVYEVTVEDANGCIVTGMATITQPDELVLTSTASNVSCFNAGDGSIDITVSGGTMPYDTQWGALPTSGFNWNYINTGTNHTIIIPELTPITLGGTPIAVGDYIGLFYDSLGTMVCAGYVEWNGINSNVAAWGTETDLGNGLSLHNGFAYGELLTWRIWQAASGLVFDAEPAYQTGYLDSAYYITDGMSGLQSLTGTVAYEYAGNSEDMINLGGGAYQVIVTDANGCTVSAEFIITEPEEIIVDAIISEYNGFGVSACGAIDGSIDVTVAGGSAPYLYSWSNGASTEDLTLLEAGLYSLTITDSEGCMVYGTYEITEFCNPVIVECVASDVSCYLGSDGSVDLTITGGLLPYSILWSNGEVTEDLTGLSEGTYEVTVIDAYGQVATCSSVIIAPTPMTIDAVITDATTYGGNDGAIDLTVFGGTPPYSYAWTNSVTNEDNTLLTAGWYGCLVTDANGCQIGFNLEVGQPYATPLSINSIIASDVSCAGASDGSIDLTIMDGLAPFTFAWSNSEATEDISNLTAGVYSVTVTDFVGTVVSASVEVFEPANTMSYTSSSIDAWSCLENGSIDITVTNGTSPYTYMWDNGSTDEDLIDAGYGVYTVVVTDASGCQMTIDNLLVNADLMSVAINSTENVCYGDANANAAVLVTGGALPYTFSWSNGATFDFIENLTAGTYTVTVTDYFGCEEIQTVDIIDPDEIIVEIVTNPIGITANVVSGAVGTVTYLWSNGKPYQSIKGLTSGVEYCVTVTDSNGCTGSACYVYTGSSVISFGGNGLAASAKEMGDDTFDNSELEVNIYPNPSKDGKIFIEFDNLGAQTIQFEIVDAYGRIVYNEKHVNSLNDRVYVEMNNINSGVYYLRIYTELSGVITKRIAIID